jgi:hypothetical protein
VPSLSSLQFGSSQCTGSPAIFVLLSSPPPFSSPAALPRLMRLRRAGRAVAVVEAVEAEAEVEVAVAVEAEAEAEAEVTAQATWPTSGWTLRWLPRVTALP